jgi:trigger factor
VDKDDELPYDQINVTQKAKAEMKASLLRQWGNLEEGKAAKEDDYIIADLDNGEHKVEGAYISLRSVSEAVRPLFIGLASGQTVEIDVNKTFENETDRAAMLKVKKEELSSLNPEFKLNVVNVKTFVPASENQETYDRIFGKDVVKTPEEFEAKIAERVRDNYTQEADARLSRDIREYFMKKADIALPEAFLKRWLISVNEGKYTPEQVEAEFGSFLTDFRWQMTRGHILRKFDLKVEDKDLHEAALSFAAYQYAMYGMGNVPQDMIEDAARRILDDENQVRRLEEQVEDRKAIEAVRANVTLQNKKISEEKFRAL